MLSYKTGNLFEFLSEDKKVLVPHIVNCAGVWGAGFVLAVSKYHPSAEKTYRSHQWDEYYLGTNQYCTEGNITVVNMCAQVMRNESTPIRYAALVACMENIYIKQNELYEEIHAPYFGCGLAGGNKDVILSLIKEIWSDIPVFLYEYNNKNSASHISTSRGFEGGN